MYCSRRGREVPRPTDTCVRCGRCNWEQNKENRQAGTGRLVTALLTGILIFLAAALLLLR